MKITDWSITPDQNTSVDGLSIAPGAAARNVGGALRAIMAGVKAAADESGEVEQFFEDHPAYLVSGKGGYLLDISPSADTWTDYLTALAKDYAAADRGALRIPYTAQRMCHVLTFSSGTEVTVYIPSQRLIRAYTYSTGEWADTGAETVPEALRRLSLVENNDALVVHLTGDETISGTKTFTQTIAGTAAAAEKLTTARTITLSGAASGSISFDGSADATLEVSIGGNQGAVIGEVRWFAMPTPPTGWLVCNGAAVGTSDYVALFAAIGKTFTPKYLIGIDPPVEDPIYSDPNHFRLPDLAGKVPWYEPVKHGVGAVIDAGLPNITNSNSPYVYQYAPDGISHTPFNSGCLTWKNDGGGIHVGTDSDTGSGRFYIDASKSSPIYGKSSTVQPPALCLLPCIRYE